MAVLDPTLHSINLGLVWVHNFFGTLSIKILPPWAAYRSIYVGHLIGLDKCPGVLPVGIEEILQHILEIFPLRMQRGCHTCLKHQPNMLRATGWNVERYSHDEIPLGWAWGDMGLGVMEGHTNNELGDINCTAMLCNLRYMWPVGGRLIFNTYRNCKVLVLCGSDATLSSK